MEVIDEWAPGFRFHDGRYFGGYGVAPDLLERIRWGKGQGRRWYREVAMAVGRRGSKGYIGSMAASYVLWNHITKGDPQSHYGGGP